MPPTRRSCAAASLGARGYDYGTTRKTRRGVSARRSRSIRSSPRPGRTWRSSRGYLYFNNVDRDRFTADFIKQAAETQRSWSRIQQRSVSRDRQLPLSCAARFRCGTASLWKAAAQRAPNDSRAWQFLALVERREGRWDDAITHFMNAVNLDPLNAGLMTTIGGETFANMRRYDDALQWLDRCVDDRAGQWTCPDVQSDDPPERRATSTKRPGVLDGFPGDDPVLVDAARLSAPAGASLSRRPSAKRNPHFPRRAISTASARSSSCISVRRSVMPAMRPRQRRHSKTLIKQLEPLRDQVDDSVMPITLGFGESLRRPTTVHSHRRSTPCSCMRTTPT